MPEWLDGVLRNGLGAVGALAMAMVTWAVARQSRKTTTEETAIDRLREDLDTLRAESTADQQALADKVARQDKRLRSQADYVHQLREHIVREKPPPPPPFPEGLRL